MKKAIEMKKNIILLMIGLALLAGVIWFFNSKQKVIPVLFTSVPAQYGYIVKTITATGSIGAVDTVSVGAQVSGVVKEVFVDFNTMVKKGQLLAKVDATIAGAQTEQSKANLANANSNLDLQNHNFFRQKELLEDGIISKAEFQIAENQYNNAKSSVDNALAQLKLAEKNLSYTSIYSPMNGVILNRNVSAGQTIASSFNAPTLFVIAKDLHFMQVRANVDEADIGGVQLKQSATFTVDAFPSAVFAGRVTDISFRASSSSNVVTYATLINVDNQDLKLRPGMTASVNIYIEEDSNALLIPTTALNFKPDTLLLKDYVIKPISKRFKANQLLGAYIWVKQGDTLTETMIITSLNDNTFVKVVEGLLPNEVVITRAVAGEADKSSPKKGTNPNTTKTEQSPFMPQMPKRPNQRR